MARITIEDCLDKIPNRFELTLAATNRARQISAGSAPLRLTLCASAKPKVAAIRITSGLWTALTSQNASDSTTRQQPAPAVA